MSDRIRNILIVGVGGQGVILASELLCETAMSAGYDVKKSEVHGMSQRGGVVSSHIRFGSKVYSPLIPAGASDAVLAFEAAEGLRWAGHVAENGVLLVNTQRIIPTIAFTKEYNYPNDPVAEARKVAGNVQSIDGIGIAERLGNKKAVNTVLLGALSTTLNIDEEIWEKIIRLRVPRGTEDLNMQAFHEGIKAVT